MTTADHYLNDEAYGALIEALASVEADPVTGKIEPSCFVEALGEVGGIWPASLLLDLDSEQGANAAL